MEGFKPVSRGVLTGDSMKALNRASELRMIADKALAEIDINIVVDTIDTAMYKRAQKGSISLSLNTHERLANYGIDNGEHVRLAWCVNQVKERLEAMGYRVLHIPAGNKLTIELPPIGG